MDGGSGGTNAECSVVRRNNAQALVLKIRLGRPASGVGGGPALKT